MTRLMGSVCIAVFALVPLSCSLIEVKTDTYSPKMTEQPAATYRGTATLAYAWGERLTPPQALSPALVNLKDALTKYSDITSTVNQNLRLGTNDLFETSVILVAASQSFDLSPTERDNLKTYLTNGGFVFMDNVAPLQEKSPGEASMRKMMRDALGSQAIFRPIPESHEIYHILFDFDEPPQGTEVGVAIQGDTFEIRSKDVNYLEGIWIGNRLVAVLSNKGYLSKWNEYENNEPQLKLGVNMVVYALMSGGIGAIDRHE